MTLFCFLMISIKLKIWNIFLTSNMLILSLPLKWDNNSLYFLDIKILRKNNKFTTSIHHKSPFSDVFTNFESFVPNFYKYALTFTLLHRAFKLCSNFELFHQEIENLKNIFRKNGYRVIFTVFCVKKYLDNLYVKKETYFLAPKNSEPVLLHFSVINHYS